MFFSNYFKNYGFISIINKKVVNSLIFKFTLEANISFSISPECPATFFTCSQNFQFCDSRKP